VIIGQEVTTDEGDVVGLFLQSTLPPFKTAAEAVKAIHRQGGLAVAVHPFSRWTSFNKMKGVGSKIFELPFDGVEICNGFVTNLISNPLATWLNRYRGQGLPEFGGSDSHVPFTVGQPCTRFPGRSAADFRQAVLAGQVRAEGMVWSFTSILRLIPVLFERGTPEQQRLRSQLVEVKVPVK
jgi:predicted metal-dependent phosphoesterase TrpH